MSPVVNRSCPDWVHRVSQSPSRAYSEVLQPEKFSRFVHCSHVPSADVQSFPGRNKGHWHCGFLSAFTATRHTNQVLSLTGRKYCLHLLCTFL